MPLVTKQYNLLRPKGSDGLGKADVYTPVVYIPLPYLYKHILQFSVTTHITHLYNSLYYYYMLKTCQ